jgi:hypothetical protein
MKRLYAAKSEEITNDRKKNRATLETEESR